MIEQVFAWIGFVVVATVAVLCLLSALGVAGIKLIAKYKPDEDDDSPEK